MRSAHAVYRKLREVKHRHLVELYRKYLRKVPANCRYNYVYTFTGEDNVEHQIRLCLLHQPDTKGLETGIFPNLVDVCQEPSHCCQCNAYLCKHSKESVREIFEEEIKNIKTKTKKYPDICALEWVLEKSVVGIPPLTWIQATFFAIKRWIVKNKIL